MPAQILYTFTIPGQVGPVTYYVQFDTGTKSIFVDTNPEQDHPQQQVAEIYLGKRIGTILRSYCEATTLVQIVVTDVYPFAKFVRTENSVSCGYVPPSGPVCDFTKFNVVATNESVAGAHDGTITIDAALTGQTLQYSLNGVDWQLDPVFKNLLPGIYMVKIKSTTTTCTQTKKVGVQAGLFVPEVPYPWQERVCKFFELYVESDDTTVPIDEPVKWDATKFMAKRNKDYHGWSSQYSDGTLQLAFACDNGKDTLTTQYETYGGDAVVKFRYGFTWLDQKQILFDGKINFNTFTKQRSYVSAVVEGKDYNNEFATRIDTKVNLSDGKSQDGNLMFPPKVYDIGLHGKAISSKFQVITNKLIDYPVFSFREATSYITPETFDATLTEISDSFTYGLLIQNEAPYDIDFYDFNLQFAGKYNFDVHFSINVTLKGRQGNQGTYKFTPMFMIDDKSYPAGPIIQGQSSATEWKMVPVNFDYVASHQITAKSKVYWFIKMETVGFIEGPSLLQTNVNITVEALEEAAGSTCKGWLLFDVIKYVSQNITDNRTSLKSNFVALKSAQQITDGEGSLYILTNGKQIRKFDVQTNPLLISMSDCLKIVRTLFCCGYGFESSGGNDFLRIERVNYFYQNHKILQIDDTIEYSEEIARDMIFNEAEFGFEKYQSSGLNSLDEFNTRHETLLPIKTHKDKLTVKSPAVGSGYSIEKCRRNQFSETPSNSVDNDEDAFIISVDRDGGNFKAEKNEAFDIVQNLISPETAYNLRLTPTRIQLNWAIWIKNILFWKQDVDVFKTNFVDQNGLLRTKLKPTDTRAVGDIFKDDWTEKDDIALSKYAVQERLFKPEYINFKAKVTPDKMIMIDKAMKGGLSSTQNYGWIAVKDNDGLYQAGFPMEMEYNFFSELLVMKLLKWHGSPVVPEEECCNYVTINGCRVLINGHKWKI